MNKQCCDGWHSGNFCPWCGKKLKEDNPLDSLLRHCESKANSLRTQKKNYQGQGVREESIKRMDGRIEKWDTWAQALRVLMHPPRKKKRKAKKKKAGGRTPGLGIGS